MEIRRLKETLTLSYHVTRERELGESFERGVYKFRNLNYRRNRIIRI